MIKLAYLQAGYFGRKQKTLADHLPKAGPQVKSNSEYTDRARSKALVGNLTGKAESLGRATIAVPNAMRLKGWSGGQRCCIHRRGMAVKQMNEGAGDAFMLTGPDVTAFQYCKVVDENSPGGTTRKSFVDDKFDGIDDFGKDVFQGNDYKYNLMTSSPHPSIHSPAARHLHSPASTPRDSGARPGGDCYWSVGLKMGRYVGKRRGQLKYIL